MKYRWSWIVFLAAEKRQPLDFSPSLSFLDGKHHICRSVNMLLVFLNQMHVQHCCCWMWVEKKTHSDIKCKQSLLAIRACGRCLYACVCGVRERWINILYYNVNVGACVPKRASMRSKQTSFCEHFHLYIICVRRTRSQYLGMETRSWLCTLYIYNMWRYIHAAILPIFRASPLLLLSLSVKWLQGWNLVVAVYCWWWYAGCVQFNITENEMPGGVYA